MSTPSPRHFGWHPDPPDHEDLHDRSAKIATLGFKVAPTATSPRRDLRAWMSPVEDQGQLGSCTAQAIAGLVEFFERRTFGNHVDVSRRFLYKVTRALLRWKGDSGGTLRGGMKAYALVGAPPEEFWSYDVARYDEEPTPLVYALAGSFKGSSYYRLDPAGTTGEQALQKVKDNLDAERPSVFGFTCYSSLKNGPDIPFPKPGERTTGGHAVLAAGYDDDRVVDGRKGALLIKNSWGLSFGEAGYGWLPYDYVTKRLAVDFWSLVRGSYVDLAPFV